MSFAHEPPRRVLVGDRPERALGAAIAAERPELEARDVHPKDIDAAALAWADAYVGFRPPRGLDLAASGVSWFHSTGAGVDAYLDVLPAGARLTRTEGDFGTRIGEYCVARALAETQGLRELEAAQRQREWRIFTPRELSGARVASIGTGRIGAAIAARFAALGCEVVGISRRGHACAPFDAVYTFEEVERGVGGCDYVVCVLPLTSATRRLIGARVLSAMRGAFLMNVGRGATVDEAALVAALSEGTLCGAALDVFEEEPLEKTSPLWSLPNVWISPHIAARTQDREIVDSFIRAFDASKEGRPSELDVDPARGY